VSWFRAKSRIQDKKKWQVASRSEGLFAILEGLYAQDLQGVKSLDEMG
jgi:hypothetical protein